MPNLVIGYDVGTTGIKTSVFEITDKIELVASAMEGYNLYIMEGGGAEQDPNEWWEAMCNTTKLVLCENNISAEDIKGISFCSQMQGLVLVDKKGEPVRRSMSYMDQRARRELREGISHGPQIAGVNVYKLLRSLLVTGAVAASVKDPVYKYKWVERNEPENFKRIYKWLDVKDYLVGKCTGKFIMTRDSAFATLLCDSRKGRLTFSKEICKMLGVKMEHLPEIIKSTDLVGGLTRERSRELGLKEGTPVYGGGGDASLIGIGAGAARLGSTHIYWGTSGWVSTVIAKRTTDLSSMIVGVVGADQNRLNYFAELETAGKCFEWVKNHLALDEINIYLKKHHVADSQEAIFTNLYDYMMDAIKDIPAGSNGVIFTPWLHGNRCPFEDPNARGMFFNISLETGKTEMIHAVLEGICYHLRWQLEAQEKKVRTSKIIRFVGGGALAPLTCQILSDVLGREIETVENPQNVGAVGAALVAAVGLGIKNGIEEIEGLIKVKERYLPNTENKEIYDKYFATFKALYRDNKKSFSILNKSK